jgi:hypothetical protein
MFGMTRRKALAILMGIGFSITGCNRSNDTTLLVNVELDDGRLAGLITTLRANLRVGTFASQRDFRAEGSLSFPTDFSIVLPPSLTGPVTIEVYGIEKSGAVLAHDDESFVLEAGKRNDVMIRLGCSGPCPAAPPGGDGGVTEDGGGLSNPGARCGNGKLDPGETCDSKIESGAPGACPQTDCNDGIACTTDLGTGKDCTLECQHTEVRSFAAGDGCCPADGTNETDRDCSASCGNGSIEAGESCDRAIVRGQPGACPAASDCQDNNACSTDYLISANTCSARCINREVRSRIAGDGCCPAGASHGSDSDCLVVCGNGEVEDLEKCDTGLSPKSAGACPMGCDDGKACTTDVLTGNGCNAECKSSPITVLAGGDGCCLPGANAFVDSDCPKVCGNGIVETGEQCDKAIPAGSPGSCSVVCASEDCLQRSIQGSAGDCSARCEAMTVQACKANDACCPTGCTSASDSDCSATCGNNAKDSGETCDTGALTPSGDRCPVACNDNNPCTRDTLVSAGTCSARCVFEPTTSFTDGDKCCPPGGNANNDGDCEPLCGNAVYESATERCDRAIAAGMPGACPTFCPMAEGCSRFELKGSSALCTSECVLNATTACTGRDGCCPSGCNTSNDNDCAPICGNRVVESPEKCDRAITAGNTGACPATCNDNNACTQDVASGNNDDCTRVCAFTNITACAPGDGCCPSVCNAATDSDCAAVCGNGIRETGELCDPPSSCPTQCSNDADVCTKAVLVGDPAKCTARCAQEPVTVCSAVSDGCCPSSCIGKANLFDADCGIITPIDPPVVE